MQVKIREALYTQQKQDEELTVTQIMNSLFKFRLKLKKIGNAIRPFRYDLNQIPYDYTVEVTNRIKELYLIVPEELWTEVCDIVQEAVIKTTSKKRNARRQNGCMRRP